MINGPNVKFTSGDQLFSKIFTSNKSFSIAIKTQKNSSLKIKFDKEELGINCFRISQFTENLDSDMEITYQPEMTPEVLSNLVFKNELSDLIFRKIEEELKQASKQTIEEVVNYIPKKL